MQIGCAQAAAGCLLIDEAKPGTAILSGLCASFQGLGMPAGLFCLDDGKNLHERLQTAYYEVRRRCAVPTIVARGQACWAALALAVQLPAERLALLDAGAIGLRYAPAETLRTVARLRGFAVRNLSFCTADILVLDDRADALARAVRRLRAARGGLTAVQMPGGGAGATERQALSAMINFLQSGEFPKSLAENPEMCIIYG